MKILEGIQMLDSAAIVIFMMMWVIGWFLLAGLALWLILVIVAFATSNRSYLNRFYKALKDE